MSAITKSTKTFKEHTQGPSVKKENKMAQTAIQVVVGFIVGFVVMAITQGIFDLINKRRKK